MKVRVWNQTGLDLWANVIVMDDGQVRFLFRLWSDHAPGHAKDVDDRLKDGQLGSWDAVDDLPDGDVGMPRAVLQATLPVPVRLTPHPRGWQGRDVFILALAPDAIN